MSITINIYYKGNKGQALQFAKEMSEKGIVSQIQAKEGNLKYDYFISLQDPDTLLLIDSWVNQEALDEHHQSSIMQEIIQLRDKYDLKMVVERYQIDNYGIPEHDQTFIRK